MFIAILNQTSFYYSNKYMLLQLFQCKINHLLIDCTFLTIMYHSNVSFKNNTQIICFHHADANQLQFLEQSGKHSSSNNSSCRFCWRYRSNDTEWLLRIGHVQIISFYLSDRATLRSIDFFKQKTTEILKTRTQTVEAESEN